MNKNIIEKNYKYKKRVIDYLEKKRTKVLDCLLRKKDWDIDISTYNAYVEKGKFGLIEEKNYWLDKLLVCRDNCKFIAYQGYNDNEVDKHNEDCYFSDNQNFYWLLEDTIPEINKLIEELEKTNAYKYSFIGPDYYTHFN